MMNKEEEEEEATTTAGANKSQVNDDNNDTQKDLTTTTTTSCSLKEEEEEPSFTENNNNDSSSSNNNNESNSNNNNNKKKKNGVGFSVGFGCVGWMQLWALMSKNGLSKYRSPLATCFELFSPVVMMLVLVAAMNLSSVEYKNAKHYTSLQNKNYLEIPGPYLDMAKQAVLTILPSSSSTKKQSSSSLLYKRKLYDDNNNNNNNSSSSFLSSVRQEENENENENEKGESLSLLLEQLLFTQQDKNMLSSSSSSSLPPFYSNSNKNNDKNNNKNNKNVWLDVLHQFHQQLLVASNNNHHHPNRRIKQRNLLEPNNDSENDRYYNQSNDNDNNDNDNNDKESDFWMILGTAQSQLQNVFESPLPVPSLDIYVGLSMALSTLVKLYDSSNSDSNDNHHEVMNTLLSESSWAWEWGNLLTLGTLHVVVANDDVNDNNGNHNDNDNDNVANDFLDFLHSTTMVSNFLTIRTHASEGMALQYVNSHLEERTWAVVNLQHITTTSSSHDDNGDASTIRMQTTMPDEDEFTFRIRMNYTTLPNTNQITDYVSIGLNRAYQRYYLSGYLTLQQTLNEFAFYRHQKKQQQQQQEKNSVNDNDNDNNNDDKCRDIRDGHSNVWSMPMPTAAYSQNAFFQAVGFLLGLTIAMSFLYPTSRLIKSMVEEKETKMKETLLILGVRPWAHWWSWLITSVLVFFIITVLVTRILSANVLTHTDPSYLFWFIGLFSTSTIGFSFTVAAFFSRAKLAAIVGPMALFATLLPKYIFFGSNRYEATTGKRWASLLPCTAFSFGADILADYEYAEQGVQSYNASEGDYSFHTAMGFLLLDTLLFFFLAWYLDQVIPRQYGVAKKWYFLLTPKYWCLILNTCCCCCCYYCGRGLFWNQRQDDYDVYDDNVSNEAWTEGTEQSSNETDFEQVTDPKLIPRVHVNDLVKRYNKNNRWNNRDNPPAVDHLNLTMYESQITCLLGHNGAGKTSVISVLTGLFPATSGDCTIYGRSISKDKDAARFSMGICPQHNVLFDNLTVMEHLALFQRIKGVRSTRKEIAERARDMGLGTFLRTTSAALSGGNKRKLSVAIALCGDSSFVLLDEPTSGMDPVSRRNTWELLRKKRVGRTILLTTHFMDEAELLADRIAVMKEGKLQCCGSSLFLKNRFGLGYNLSLVLDSSSVPSITAAKGKEEVKTTTIADADIVLHSSNATEDEGESCTESSDSVDSRQPSNVFSVIASSFQKLVHSPKDGSVNDSEASTEDETAENSDDRSLSPLEEGTAGTVVSTSSLSTDPITRFLKEQIEGIELVRKSAREVTYRFPPNSEDLLPAIFEAIESNAGNLGIGSYGVSNTTLEEVFLQLAGNEKKESPADGRESISDNTSVTGSSSTPSVGQNDELSSAAPESQQTGELVHMSAFSQVLLLLQKRFLIQKRDLKGAFFAIVLPVLLVALVLLILIIEVPLAGPAIEMSAGLYGTSPSGGRAQTEILVSGKNASGRQPSSSAAQLRVNLKQDYPHAVYKELSANFTCSKMSQYMLDTYNDHDHPERYGAFVFNDEIDGSIKLDARELRKDTAALWDSLKDVDMIALLESIEFDTTAMAELLLNATGVDMDTFLGDSDTTVGDIVDAVSNLLETQNTENFRLFLEDSKVTLKDLLDVFPWIRNRMANTSFDQFLADADIILVEVFDAVSSIIDSRATWAGAFDAVISLLERGNVIDLDTLVGNSPDIAWSDVIEAISKSLDTGNLRSLRVFLDGSALTLMDVVDSFPWIEKRINGTALSTFLVSAEITLIEVFDAASSIVNNNASWTNIFDATVDIMERGKAIDLGSRIGDSDITLNKLVDDVSELLDTGSATGIRKTLEGSNITLKDILDTVSIFSDEGNSSVITTLYGYASSLTLEEILDSFSSLDNSTITWASAIGVITEILESSNVISMDMMVGYSNVTLSAVVDAVSDLLDSANSTKFASFLKESSITLKDVFGMMPGILKQANGTIAGSLMSSTIPLIDIFDSFEQISGGLSLGIESLSISFDAIADMVNKTNAVVFDMFIGDSNVTLGDFTAILSAILDVLRQADFGPLLGDSKFTISDIFEALSVFLDDMSDVLESVSDFLTRGDFGLPFEFLLDSNTTLPFALLQGSELLENASNMMLKISALLQDVRNDDRMTIDFTIQSTASVLHNSSSPHAVGAFNQLYMENMYKDCTSKSFARLRSINHPLPLTNQQSVEIKTILSVFASLFILIPYCYIPAAFVVFLVKERVCKSKHLQLVSGVNMSAYWVAAYLWDVFMYSLLTIAVMVVFVFYGSDSAQVFVGSSESFVSTFLLTFGYGLSGIPLAYLLSRNFENHSSAQIAVMGIFFITGFGAVLAYYIMDSVDTTKQLAGRLLPLFRCFPPYNVGDGFLRLSASFWDREILSGDTYPLDWEVAGKPIALLFLLAPTYFMVLLLLEYAHDGGAGGLLGRSLRGLKRMYSRVILRLYGVRTSKTNGALLLDDGLDDETRYSESTRSSSMDNDVNEERERVTANKEDLKISASVLIWNLWKVFPPSVGVVSSVVNFIKKWCCCLCCLCCRSVASDDPEKEDKSLMPKRAVRSLTTAVEDGEIYGLLGVNGAGKTTTLGVLTGDVAPTGGEAYVAGYDVTGATPGGVSEARKHIGFCPQVDPLLDLMTGRETLRMFGKLRGIPPGEQLENCIQDLLDRLTLTPHADKNTDSYSGGNKRKLSLGIALIGDPKVLFIDEASSGMDPAARRNMWELIAEASKSRSVVLTTHSMEEAEALCTRVGIMISGRLRCLGSVQHLKSTILNGLYAIDVNCKSHAPSTVVDSVEGQILQDEAVFGGVKLSERHGRFLKFEVSSMNDSGLGRAFHKLQAMKSNDENMIENYSISQCSLERVFINLARANEEHSRQISEEVAHNTN